MRKAKYLLFAGMSVAAVLLLTSDKAKEMRDELEEKARKAAKNVKDKLNKLSNDTSGAMAELKQIMSANGGLNSETHQRIKKVLNNNPTSAGRIKRILISQYPELIFYL